MSEGAVYVVCIIAAVVVLSAGIVASCRPQPSRNVYVRDAQTGECRAVSGYVVLSGECNPRVP